MTGRGEMIFIAGDMGADFFSRSRFASRCARNKTSWLITVELLDLTTSAGFASSFSINTRPFGNFDIASVRLGLVFKVIMR